MGKYSLNVLLIHILFVSSAFGQRIWKDDAQNRIADDGIISLSTIPENYRLLNLDIDALKENLSLAPTEYSYRTYGSAIILQIPMPDGSNQRFEVFESPIMKPGLMAKFPLLKTYCAQGIDDPTATMRFDVTPKGFKAMILSVHGTYIIDPYLEGDVKRYLSYDKRSLKNNKNYKCLYEKPIDFGEFVNRTANTTFSNGQILRIYRFACATTTQYDNFHGGTIADVMAALVTSTNRLNSVFERDLAIRLVLVDGNENIIGAADRSTNQTLIDTEIGTENYDIGHTFDFGGGGVANLGAVCKEGVKAEGYSSFNPPEGDVFDIDYVAHEIGHQFNGRHTFNGTTNACGGGNRSPGAAYEPGSGTTIQAYAGICSPQNNSDDYYHTISLQEMIGFISSFQSCPEMIETNNTPPVANIDMNTSLTIPINTPFELTGISTDADQDVVTYCWEQFDLGPAGSPQNPSGNAPIFRSFSPTLNPIRTFPQLSDILTGTSTIGEILPSYARSLNFRLTVRDNNAAGGGVHCDNYTVNVNGEAGPFQITTPDELSFPWTEGVDEKILWEVANTDTAPVNCSEVDILLSLDGGINFNIILAQNVPNSGESQIEIPQGTITNTARLKLKCSDNIFFDISDDDFEILEGNFLFNLELGLDSVFICQGRDAQVELNLTSFDGFTDNVSISINPISDDTVVSITPNIISGNGTAIATISESQPLPLGTYEIQVIGQAAGSISVESFVLIVGHTNNPVVSITSPKNGSLVQSLQPTISWKTNRSVKTYDLEVSTDSLFNFDNEIFSRIDQISFTFPTDLQQGTEYFIRVRAVEDCSSGVWSEIMIKTEGIVTSTNDQIRNFVTHRLYPNPVRDLAIIELESPTHEDVIINVYNPLGQYVNSFLLQEKTGNNRLLSLNTSDLQKGLYFYEILLYSSGQRSSHSFIVN